MSDLRELWQYRELLLILIRRDLKVRYKNSVLGFGWSLINPLVQVVIITLVLKVMLRSNLENYHAYVFCAMLPWLFFSTALMDSSLSLLLYNNLLRRTYFPREIVPLASVAANLVHFLLATAVFLVYMAGLSLFFWAKDGDFSWPILPTVFLIPIPMLGLVLLVSGIALFASVWTLYFEDTRFILDSGLKLLYWLVPVLYYPDMLLEAFKGEGGHGRLFYTLYMLNPLAAFMTAFRKLTLPPAIMPGQAAATSPMGGPEWLFLGIAFLVSLAVAAAGYRFYSTRKWRLAERG
jgi:lipopolysaccharide transport system permease protein